MTVIAWDGKTLAADRRALLSGVPMAVTKIFKVGDNLAGFSHTMSRGLALVQWLKDGANAAAFPKPEDKDDYANLLVVSPGGALFKYENSPNPIIYEPGQQFAMGSGRDFALMAMLLGKTAREAVDLTCGLTVECGNGIDTLEFD